ncbi:hypothetical protein L218DRAFT_735073 [Marasmius fiardii PR-910]|nr:hypothetical protein L218DRAFT_735073 [Marasmius fiardii PR-910]
MTGVEDLEVYSRFGLCQTAVAGLLGLYRYLRSFLYPCLTLFELEEASKALDDVYRITRNVLAGLGDVDIPEWNVIANDYLSLKIEASQIREKSFQGSQWKTYLGFHPRLMLEIADCYTKLEELRCRILAARERDLQSHLGAEQYRRQLAVGLLPQADAFASEAPRPYNGD